MSGIDRSGMSWELSEKPARGAAAADLLIYAAVAGAVYGIEEWLRAEGLFPLEGLANGAPTLIASLFLVFGLAGWRGQRGPDLGFRRPPTWWFIPVWGLAVIAATIAGQILIRPVLAATVTAEPPDLSRYQAIFENLPLFLLAALGSMFTGGFIEEVIYRGFLIDRLARLLGGGRGGLVAAALLCGVPFGLIHFQWGLTGILLTTLMGSILGVMYLLTRRNLWPLIAGHATLDAILMAQIYFMGTNLG